MGDEWRVKRYYGPRVLIETDAVLSPLTSGALVCLTGAHLAILRPLLQYATRRANFVSEYSEATYLCPSESEWDELQAVVASLEETLMGCDDIETILEDIAAQLACVCDAVTGLQVQDDLPVDSAIEGQPNYDDYLSPVIEDEGDPPEGFATWDDWREYKCKGLQKFWDDVVVTMERIQTATGAGTVVTFLVVEAALAGTVVLSPLALVMAIAALLAAVGLAGIQEAARDWVAAHKQGLVCVMYLESSADAARAAAIDYIETEWDVAGSSEYVKRMLNRWTVSGIFDGTMAGYETWGGDYSATYCAACAGLPAIWAKQWNFPACPQDWTGDAVCWDGHLCMRLDNPYADVGPWYVAEADTLELCAELDFTSNRGAGKFVCALTVQWSADGETDWQTKMNWQPSTQVDAGELNQVARGETAALHQAGYWRAHLSFPSTYNEIEPYPYMGYRVKIYTREP